MDEMELSTEVEVAATSGSDYSKDDKDELVQQFAKEDLLSGFIVIKDASIKDEEDDDEDDGVSPPNPNPEVDADWNKLKQRLEQDLAYKKKGGRGKRGKNVSFKEILDVVEKLALGEGLSNERLANVWELVSNPDVKFTVTERTKLLFAMIPSEKVDGDLILRIVSWLEEATGHGFKPSVVMTTYKLLALYIENGFTKSGGSLASGGILDMIVSTNTDSNTTIPWKMLCFRNVCTPLSMNRIHILDLESLLTKDKLRKTQVADINRTLMHSKFAAEGDVDIVVKLRDLKFPKDMAERLSIAKARMEVLDEAAARNKLAKFLFPECIAQLNAEGSDNSSLEKLLMLLDTNEGINEIAFDPKKLNLFQDWLNPIIDYRLEQFCGFCSKDELEKYAFIFDKCYSIIEKRGEGLESINRWLIGFLICWDFQSFSNVIFKFVPYLNSSDVLPYQRKMLADRFVDHFTFSPNVRLSIWNALGRLFLNWLKKFIAEPDSGDLCESLEWLQDMLRRCVEGVVLTAKTFDKKNDFDLVFSIVSFYKWLQHQCKADPRFCAHFGKVPHCFAGLVYLSKSPKILEEAQFLIDTVKDNLTEAGGVKDPVASNLYAMTLYACGALGTHAREVIPDAEEAGREDNLGVGDADALLLAEMKWIHWFGNGATDDDLQTSDDSANDDVSPTCDDSANQDESPTCDDSATYDEMPTCDDSATYDEMPTDEDSVNEDEIPTDDESAESSL